MKPIKTIIIRAENGVEFTADTEISWDTDGIETIGKTLVGKKKRTFLVQVLIKSQYLQKGQTCKVFAGDCSGELKIRAF